MSYSMVLAVLVIERLGIEPTGRDLSHEIFGVFEEPPKLRWRTSTTWKAAGTSHYRNGLPGRYDVGFGQAAHDQSWVESINWTRKSRMVVNLH
jgi:hypothetical protein